MEEDPEFVKLVNKSFILQKARDLEVPMVPKAINTQHQAISKLFLTTMIHIFAYGFDTIKTRSQSINPLQDVAHFKQNTSSKQPLYQGFFKGYINVVLSNAVHVTIGKQYGYAIASMFETIPKTFIEISKINSQMGHKSTQMGLLKIAYKNCLPFVLLRDLILRSTIVQGMKYYNKKHIHDPHFIKKHNQTNGLIAICMAATFVSNPFDVMVTKLASQRYIKYENPLQAVKLVVKEEGFQKLFFSGSFPRILFIMVEAMVMKHAYQHIAELARDAF